MTTAYSADRWTDFGVATVGATAALAGLLLVAVSINLKLILDERYPTLPNRAAQTLIFFALPLFTALLLLVPGQPGAALSWEMIVTGVSIGAYLLVADFRLPLTEYETKLTWTISRLAPAVVICGSLIVAGATLLAHSGGGLYWVVPSVLGAIAFGLFNVWVLLIEILR
jgi:hypothetical protein